MQKTINRGEVYESILLPHTLLSSGHCPVYSEPFDTDPASVPWNCGQCLIKAWVRAVPDVISVPHGRLMDSRFRPHFYGGETVVAVNIGGAVIPVLLSIYLILSVWIAGEGTFLYSIIAGIFAVTAVTHIFARPTPGIGIAVPLLLPPLCALLCGILLSFGVSGMSPVIAYVSGTLGTLLGADLLNLGKLRDIGADTLSIGGAGTFDGIFLTGIIAALLA